MLTSQTVQFIVIGLPNYTLRNSRDQNQPLMSETRQCAVSRSVFLGYTMHCLVSSLKLHHPLLRLHNAQFLKLVSLPHLHNCTIFRVTTCGCAWSRFVSWFSQAYSCLPWAHVPPIGIAGIEQFSSSFTIIMAPKISNWKAITQSSIGEEVESMPV